MSFFASCAYLRGNLRVRLATQRKSLRKFNLRPLATTYRSVWPGLNGRHLTYVDLDWVAKRCKTCVDLRANLISTKVRASHRKSTQVHASPGKTESQVDPSSQLAATCDSVWPGLNIVSRPVSLSIGFIFWRRAYPIKSRLHISHWHLFLYHISLNSLNNRLHSLIIIGNSWRYRHPGPAIPSCPPLF